MRISGPLQAEIFKTTLGVIAAGIVLYYGKKFVDAAGKKLGSIADAPAAAVTALGDAVGATGAAIVDTAKSGIEAAAANVKQIAPIAENPVIVNTARTQKSSGFAIPAPIAAGFAIGQSMGDKLLSALGVKSSYGVNYENQQF